MEKRCEQIVTDARLSLPFLRDQHALSQDGLASHPSCEQINRLLYGYSGHITICARISQKVHVAKNVSFQLDL